MSDFVFEQGCTYNPKFTITINDKVPTSEDVYKIHFLFRNVMKTFPNNEEVEYKDGRFIVHLRSQDTLDIPAGCEHKINVLVKFPRGEIKPVKIEAGTFTMEPAPFPREVYLDERKL